MGHPVPAVLFFRNIAFTCIACDTLGMPELDPMASAASAASEPKVISRPFRVKLRGSVLVLMRLPNKRDVRAAIHQLSVTGGVVHLEKPLDEKLQVEMVFHIGEATVREKAQMLFPMWATQGWMQPFRFIEMSDESRAGLDASLKSYLGEPAKSSASSLGATSGATSGA